MCPAHDKGVGGYYYPIYKGWATTVTPIFETASTAICFQISQYKRDLCEHNTIKTPVWLDVIGSIDPSDFANIISHKFQSTSLIKNSYFDQVCFFQVKRDLYLKSRLVRINSQTFLCCKNTMKDNTDYLSSSSLIYKAGSFCVIEHNMKSISYCFDSTGISQKRDTNNHPLFGKTKRYGWAAMRNSDEWSFTVGDYKSVLDDKNIAKVIK